jgi:hypothetical protein
MSKGKAGRVTVCHVRLPQTDFLEGYTLAFPLRK